MPAQWNGGTALGIRAGRDATGLRTWYAGRDARLEPTDPCTSGSGAAFADCHDGPPPRSG